MTVDGLTATLVSRPTGFVWPSLGWARAISERGPVRTGPFLLPIIAGRCVRSFCRRRRGLTDVKMHDQVPQIKRGGGNGTVGNRGPYPTRENFKSGWVGLAGRNG